MGNPYQMGDNKAAPSAPPQGGGASRRPLGVLVVTHLVRISYVFAPFSEPVLAPGIVFSPAGRGKFYNPGWGLVWAAFDGTSCGRLGMELAT